MKNDEYFFDKRKRKRSLIKYLIIFGLAFIPVVALNVAMGEKMSKFLVILIDCIILLIFVLVGNLIANKIFEVKDKKLEAKIRARKEVDERKQKILEDSYKQKKIQKQKNKHNNNSKEK